MNLPSCVQLARGFDLGLRVSWPLQISGGTTILFNAFPYRNGGARGLFLGALSRMSDSSKLRPSKIHLVFLISRNLSNMVDAPTGVADIRHQLATQIVAAMRSKDRKRLDVLREIQNIVVYADKETGEVASDVKITALLSGHRAEAESTRDELLSHGKTELAAHEASVIEAISTYLPKASSTNEILSEAKEIAAQAGLSQPKDLGRLIKALMEKLGGRASNKAIGEAAKAVLFTK